MIINKNKVNLLLVMAALAIVSLFVSCKKSFQSSSFLTNLQQVDDYVAEGNTKEAVILLKKTQKMAQSSYDFIGVYNRYILLGDSENAEKVLVRGLKHVSDDLELRAVYTNFLLRHNLVEEAFKQSKHLLNTEYSSLYSEAVLRLALEGHKSADEIFDGVKYKENKKNASEIEEKRKNVFYDERFVPVYLSSYQVSHNPLYQIDASCIYLIKGDYEKAVSFYDNAIYTSLQSLFWGYVLYDAGYYAKSLESLLLSEKLVSPDEDLLVEILVLQSDDYHILGEDSLAKDIRDSIIAQSSENSSSDSVKKLLPLVYMNNYSYGRVNKDMKSEYRSLMELISIYPDNIEGLCGLASYSLEYLNRPKEDSLSQELRSSGLRTLEMEEYDRVPPLTLADVAEKIDNAYRMRGLDDGDSTKDLNFRTSLFVLKQKMYDSINLNLSPSQKVSNIWKMLDENFKSGSDYTSEAVRYAVCTLIKQKYIEDASDIFYAYIRRLYGEDADIDDFTLKLWESEMHAYFSTSLGDRSKGISTYQNIIDHYGKINTRMLSREQSISIINAYVNLADVYSSANMESSARDMLNNAANLCQDDDLKSEILYRLAVVDSTMGNKKNAVRELQYALSLDDSMNKARFMLKKLHAEE